MIGFHAIDWANEKTSIGYWLASEFEGNGIVSGSVRTLLDMAFTEYKLNRVEIRAGVKNQKSKNIPERLGFACEGIIRDGEYLYDHFHDVALYSMLRSEWG